MRVLLSGVCRRLRRHHSHDNGIYLGKNMSEEKKVFGIIN